MRRVVCEDVEHHEFKPTGATNLEEEVVDRARGELRRLNLVGGVWDKAPTRFYAICSVLRDARLLRDTLGGSKFAIWGWFASVKDTHHVIVHEMLSKATGRGIIADWVKRARPKYGAWLQNRRRQPPKG